MNPRWLVSHSLLLLLVMNELKANPQGFELIHGEAKLPTLDGQTLTVETGHQAILHWNDFSIAEGETTRFVMPHSNSHILNRVTGGNLSKIYGRLEANGKVVLVNPKGVVFGNNAYVDTAAFIASSLDILDADFLKNGDLLFSGDSSASIVNLGTISAWEGDIALIGYQVVNKGEISAPNGVASLAAGTHVLFRPLDNERIAIRVSVLKDIAEIGIENSGAIQAIAAELKADGHLYQYAIKDSGQIEATGLEERGGRIFLVAEEGALSAQGSYTARAEAEGGDIRFLGNEVRVEETAKIVSSGERSGGQILIGGDYQGDNPDIPNAKVTYVAPHTRIAADALVLGDGGKVILWGDTATGFYGNISAQGGAMKGDGGFVEVSSPGYFDFQGLVNTKAAFGKTGTLLLDPCAVTISTGIDSGDFSGCPGGTYNFSPSSSAIINNLMLQSNLNTCSVTIDASGSGMIGATGSILLEAGAPVTWSTNTLTLRAYDVGSTITLNDVLTANSGGAVNVNDNNTNNTTLSITSTAVLTNAGIMCNGAFSVQVGTIDISPGPEQGFIVCTGSSGTSTITTNSLTLTGGPAVPNAGIGSSTDLLVVCNGLISMPGNISGAYIETLSGGNLSIQSIGLALDGEGPVSTIVQTSGGGTISIDGYDATHSGAITLTGTAEISTISGGGSIHIGQNASKQLPTDLTLQSNSMGESFIFSGLDVIASISGNYMIEGVVNPAYIEAFVMGNLTLNGNSLTLSGNTATAEITAFTKNIELNIADAITLSPNGAQTSISTSSGNIAIQSGGLALNGTQNALITTTGGGNITIDGFNGSISGPISLAENAQITTVAGGSISIGQNGTSQVPTSLSLQAGNSSTSTYISASGGSTIASTISGAYSITGGSNTSPAYIQTLANNITLTGGSLTLTGGSLDATSPASINTISSGNISITCDGSVELLSNTSHTLISTTSTSDLSIESIGLMLSSASGTVSAALQTTTGALAIDGFNGTSSGAITLDGNAQIKTTSGAIKIGQNGNAIPTGLTLQGGSSNAALAEILTSSGGNITCNVQGPLTLAGGSGSGTSALIRAATHGVLTLGCQDLTITGGSNTSSAGIETQMGDITLTCLGDCTFNAANVNSPALLQTFGSDLTLTVAGSASFDGFTTISTPAPTGNLLIIAGENLSIGGNASITAPGTTNSSLILVCDNDFPSSPTSGPGQFNLTGSAIVSAGNGSPVRIFTSQREQNTISAPINGTTFVPGTEFVDTPTEQWYTYYSSTFGGDPFTLFYKHPPIPVTPTTFNPQPSITDFAFLSCQVFFDLDDRFVYYDWYYWSDFTVKTEIESGGVNHKGYSIRMRMEDLLKNSTLRGFAL